MVGSFAGPRFRLARNSESTVGSLTLAFTLCPGGLQKAWIDVRFNRTGYNERLQLQRSSRVASSPGTRLDLTIFYPPW